VRICSGLWPSLRMYSLIRSKSLDRVLAQTGDPRWRMRCGASQLPGSGPGCKCGSCLINVDLRRLTCHDNDG